MSLKTEPILPEIKKNKCKKKKKSTWRTLDHNNNTTYYAVKELWKCNWILNGLNCFFQKGYLSEMSTSKLLY